MLQNLKNKLEQSKGKQKMLSNDLKSLRESKRNSKKNLIQSEKAQVVIQEVARETQNQIKFHIEDIVSMALAAIFPDPYTLELDFPIKRNKTECELWFVRNGKRTRPVYSNGIPAVGVGTIDIASFALIIALWNLKFGQKNNTILLDEPVKFVSKDLIYKVGELMQKLNKKLGIQFIVTTHIKELAEYADKIFTVIRKNEVSSVKSMLMGGKEVPMD